MELRGKSAAHLQLHAAEAFLSFRLEGSAAVHVKTVKCVVVHVWCQKEKRLSDGFKHDLADTSAAHHKVVFVMRSGGGGTS